MLYVALLAFVTWVAKSKNKEYFEKTIYLVLLVYPPIILSHEMLAIFLPYIVAVYILVVPIDRKKAVILFLLLLPSIVSLIAALYYSGNQFQEAEIFASLTRQNYTITGGAISWLSVDTAAALRKSMDGLGNHSFYLLNIALALIAYIPVCQKFRAIGSNKFALLLIAISLLGSVAVLSVALDWGRVIYIHLVSIFFLLLTVSSDQDTSCYWFSKKVTKKGLILFFTAYALLWSIPHAGAVFKKTFRQPNVVGFVVPYVKVIRFYYRANDSS